MAVQNRQIVIAAYIHIHHLFIIICVDIFLASRFCMKNYFSCRQSHLGLYQASQGL